MAVVAFAPAVHIPPGFAMCRAAAAFAARLAVLAAAGCGALLARAPAPGQHIEPERPGPHHPAPGEPPPGIIWVLFGS